MRLDLMRPLPWIVLGLALSASLAVHLEFSPDSMHYVDIAKRLASGQGLSSYHLNVYSESVPDRVLLWPPAYPVLLAACMKIGLAGLWAVRAVFILAFLVTSACIYSIGRLFSSKAVGLISLLVWLAMAPQLHIWSFAWSEPPFIALSSLFILAFAASARDSFHPAKMFLAGVLAGSATMCRYTGATTVAAGLIALAWLTYARLPRRRLLAFIRSAVLLISGFASVSTPWFMRNLSLTGSLAGMPRPPAVVGPIESAARMVRSVGADLIMPLGIMAVLLTLSARNRSGWFSALARSAVSSDRPVTTISAVWISVYCITLLVAASLWEFDLITSRLMSPVYIVLIPLLVQTGYGMFAGAHGMQDRLSPRALGLVFALLLASTIVNGGARFEVLKRDRAAITPVEEWIKESTQETSLFVAIEAWWIRFRTGRAVLESGDAEDLTPQKVCRFLDRFGDRFSSIYLLTSGPVLPSADLVRQYADCGYSLSQRYSDGDHTVSQIVRQPD